MRGFFIIMLISGTVLLGAGCTQEAVEVQENIIYGTNADPVFIQESKNDCQEKGGVLNECGSACADGEICVAVCTVVCEF